MSSVAGGRRRRVRLQQGIPRLPARLRGVEHLARRVAVLARVPAPDHSIPPAGARPRQSGWTIKKKVNYLMDSIFSFTDLPVRLLMVFGIIGVVVRGSRRGRRSSPGSPAWSTCPATRRRFSWSCSSAASTRSGWGWSAPTLGAATRTRNAGRWRSSSVNSSSRQTNPALGRSRHVVLRPSQRALRVRPDRLGHPGLGVRTRAARRAHRRRLQHLRRGVRRERRRPSATG